MSNILTNPNTHISQLFVYMESKKIISEIKKLLGLHTDTALAERLGASKQVISRFKNKKTIDIQAKIIKLLLEELESRK